jgi:hypothetical protein
LQVVVKLSNFNVNHIYKKEFHYKSYVQKGISL